ncbi:MAG: tetratricopeptide repeat protein [Blastocatellia bacterium]|nr:tetratricopeptide repeat protein [Blastocatellia bacterium]
MKSILREIQSDLSNFIIDPSLSLLIVSCEIEHSAFLLKSIDALEQDPDVLDIFLTFGHEFDNQSTYVDVIFDVARQQITQINQELAKRDQPLLADLPADIEDPSLLPAAKLGKLLQHFRNLIPNNRRIVWIFYPQEIIDPPRYLQLIEYLLGDWDTSSLLGTKLIARDSDTPSVLATRLAGFPETKVYRAKLDPDSFEKLLNAKTQDSSVPAEERAQMHMMLAGYDVAHQRFDTALVRNTELLRYFNYTRQQHNQSIVLNNIGDLFYIQKRWPEAQNWYERAVAMSLELKSQPLVHYQCLNLGNALLMQNKYAESLIYYRVGERLAESSGAIVQQIHALERIAYTCYESKQLEEAAEAWEKAASLNKKLKNIEGEQADLEQLCRVYSEIGDNERYKECLSKLSRLV